MDVTGVSPKASVPRIAFTGAASKLPEMLKALTRRTHELIDLEPGRNAFAKIRIEVGAKELFPMKIEEITKEIFGSGLRPEVFEEASRRVGWILKNVGFSSQVDPTGQAKIMAAFLNNWTEIKSAMDWPDKVKRYPIFGFANDRSHTTCRHQDDYAYIKIKYPAMNEDVESIGKEILSALKFANEIIYVTMNDAKRKSELSNVYKESGMSEQQLEGLFLKDGVKIRYSSTVRILLTGYLRENINIKKIEEALKQKGYKAALLGIIVDNCSEDHPSFIKYDEHKHLALVVISEKQQIGEEIEQGIFKNIIPTNIELWKDGDKGGHIRLVGAEFQLSEGKMNDSFLEANIIKAVTLLHRKSPLQRHLPAGGPTNK